MTGLWETKSDRVRETKSVIGRNKYMEIEKQAKNTEIRQTSDQ